MTSFPSRLSFTSTWDMQLWSAPASLRSLPIWPGNRWKPASEEKLRWMRGTRESWPAPGRLTERNTRTNSFPPLSPIRYLSTYSRFTLMWITTTCVNATIPCLRPVRSPSVCEKSRNYSRRILDSSLRSTISGEASQTVNGVRFQPAGLPEAPQKSLHRKANTALTLHALPLDRDFVCVRLVSRSQVAGARVVLPVDGVGKRKLPYP